MSDSPLNLRGLAYFLPSELKVLRDVYGKSSEMQMYKVGDIPIINLHNN